MDDLPAIGANMPILVPSNTKDHACISDDTSIPEYLSAAIFVVG